MTRRIALAMLLTVWGMLVAGGVTAYLTTRAVLLENMDAALVARAAALPGAVHAAGVETPAAPTREGDRFLIQNEHGQTIARPPGAPAAAAPVVLSAAFTQLADGSRWRSVTIRVLATPPDGRGPAAPVTVSYSTPAAPFDRLLNRLGLALAAVGLIGGLVAAGVAVRVSSVALRPLRQTAQQIGEIDERALNRRIDTARLPTELLPMAQRLNEMLARLQEAFDQRRRFLADASHELRTPVAALMTAMQISLRHPRDAEAYRRTLETCSADATYLRQLVERLMEQVRSELPDAGEAAEPVDTGRLLEQCAGLIEPLAQAKGIELRREIAPGLADASWLTQPGRVRSIAVNLLSNAVEYTPAGGKVVFTASIGEAGLRLVVSDTGLGIASEHVPHLFEPFYRADKSRSRDAGHLGLGLALVHAHLQALGGKCTVSSQLGKGTTFEVQLPYQAYESREPEPVASADPEPRTTAENPAALKSEVISQVGKSL